MSGAMPCDMLVDASTLDPMLQCLVAGGRAAYVEKKLVGFSATYQGDEVMPQRYSVGTFGLLLLECEGAFLVVDVAITQLFHVAVSQSWEKRQ